VVYVSVAVNNIINCRHRKPPIATEDVLFPVVCCCEGHWLVSEVLGRLYCRGLHSQVTAIMPSIGLAIYSLTGTISASPSQVNVVSYINCKLRKLRSWLMEEVDKVCLMIRMGMSGWLFLLAQPGSHGHWAIKWLCMWIAVNYEIISAPVLNWRCRVMQVGV